MQDIKPWTDYIASLPDSRFFYLMRLYLGDIKTPFNKVRLGEQLASFIRNKQNIENLLSMLDETDIKLLTVIKLIPSITAESFIQFFNDEYSSSVVLNRLENLQTRLLIFTEKKEYSPKVFYKLNPLLEEELTPYLNPEVIFNRPEPDHVFLDSPFSLSPNFIAAFISYLNVNGCSLKSDSTFKKTDVTNLNEIFGEKIICLQHLVTAFINLGLVQEGEKNLVVNEKRFADFASMNETEQYIALAISSVMRLSRDSLKKQCQLLADTLASVPESGCTRKLFLRLVQVVAGKPSMQSAVKTVSRFSELLNQARGMDNTDVSDAYSLMDAAFEAITEFGLLTLYGENESDGSIYKAGFCNDNVNTFVGNNPKVLNINASSSVTLLPGLSLKALLPLTNFILAVNCSTVTECEITRKSVSCAFDKGMTLERIKELLSGYASFELPQNLLFNLDEWHNAYSSAVLYKGFILKVSKDNSSLVENNPSVNGFVQEKLADGVYLLNIPYDADPAVFLKASGLDFMGSVKSVKPETEVFSYPRISKGSRIVLSAPGFEYKDISQEKCKETVQKFLKSLNGVTLDEHQMETMQSRIFNHLIISESQVKSSSVKTEVLVADGMDFQGKVHLIDASIKSNDNLEISMMKTDGSGELYTKLIHPVKLIKTEGEVSVKFEYLPGKECGIFDVSRIVHIKRLRTDS